MRFYLVRSQDTEEFFPMLAVTQCFRHRSLVLFLFIAGGAMSVDAESKPLPPGHPKVKIPEEGAMEKPLWSLQPVVKPAIPKAGQGWSKLPVDRFIFRKLAETGLKPSPAAERTILLRRLFFDLTGLPPTPAELSKYRNLPLRQVVDDLLSRPQFGERWGRHWLDIARYGESNGKSRDVLMPHAWRYRDYVYDVFNADLPFDQFVREQIAGDLLEAKSQEVRDRMLTATGFLTLGSKTLTTGGKEFELNLVDEQIDVLTKGVMALTVACARCHDHKFDPIPTRDYYAMVGIFTSTDTKYGHTFRNQKDPAYKHLMVLGADAEKKVEKMEETQKEISKLRKQEQSLNKKTVSLEKKLPADLRKQVAAITSGKMPMPAAKEPEVKKLAEVVEMKEKILDLKEDIKELASSPGAEIEYAMAVKESAKPADARIAIRGEVSDLGETVPRGFLSCVHYEGPAIGEESSGRRELAEWMTDPRNPFTARVAVNRIWLHLFGQGIVETIDNFGVNGIPPTHPELLDYLAARFVELKWSQKAMIREIVLTRTYQQSAAPNHAAFEKDPGNKLYWQMSRRRLEAESIRDAMLAASGELDLKRPEGSAVAEIGKGEVGRGINTKPLFEDHLYRSAYLPVVRGIVPEFLKQFDFPEPSNPQGKRDASDVPAQALFLMNSPFVDRRSEAMSKRIAKHSPRSDLRIKHAYQIAYARPPSAVELKRAQQFVGDGKNPDSWIAFCQALLASSEFRNIE